MTRKEYDDYVARFKAFMEREGINTLTPVGNRADGEWEYYFTWRKCAACGDTDGGNRTECAGFNPTTHEIQSGYEVCEDCVYFNEYGQLDDLTMLSIDQSELCAAYDEHLAKQIEDSRREGE